MIFISTGFHCVPKFHGERFMKWREENEAYGNAPEIVRRNFVEVPDDDPMRSEATKVPMRAGSLLIWNSQLPHGNYCYKISFHLPRQLSK